VTPRRSLLSCVQVARYLSKAILLGLAAILQALLKSGKPKLPNQDITLSVSPVQAPV
jgi:hypothetical protein